MLPPLDVLAPPRDMELDGAPSLDEHAPKLVLVTLGGNDMLRKLPEEQTRANLARILELVRGRNAQPVLLATPKPSIAMLMTSEPKCAQLPIE